MKKRLFALVTAICCMAMSAPVVSAFAEEEQPVREFVVVSRSDKMTAITATDEVNIFSDWYCDTFYVFNWEEDGIPYDFHNLEVGDIVEYTGDYLKTEMLGVNTFSKIGEDSSFRKTGSIFENPVTAGFEFVDGSENMKLFDGEKEITYFDTAGYDALKSRPFGFDWNAVKVGDTVQFYTYKGTPLIPYEVVSAPMEAGHYEEANAQAQLKKGDIDGSGEVDIVDVLAINQALLGLREFSETAVAVADVNGNGSLDDGDAVMILKSLVGLTVLL